VKPEEDSKEENGIGGASAAHMKDRTPAQEEAWRKLNGVFKESGLCTAMIRRFLNHV
jgi:hypothetical protein